MKHIIATVIFTLTTLFAIGIFMVPRPDTVIEQLAIVQSTIVVCFSYIFALMLWNNK